MAITGLEIDRFTANILTAVSATSQGDITIDRMVTNVLTAVSTSTTGNLAIDRYCLNVVVKIKPLLGPGIAFRHVGLRR